MNYSTAIEFDAWFNNLHPKRQTEFLCLSQEHQDLVKNASARNRRTALRTLDYTRRQINGRAKWVEGLDHLEEFLKNPGHFFQLAFSGDVASTESMVDLLIDFKAGEYENIKNTDPVIYDLLTRAQVLFERREYDCSAGMKIADYFKRHPHQRPLSGRYPEASQIATRQAMRLGARLKQQRRLAGLTQEQMATALGTSSKTVKNMEAGKPVSSHTLLMSQRILSHQQVPVRKANLSISLHNIV